MSGDATTSLQISAREPLRMKVWRMMAAETLGVSESAVAMWLKRGRVRPVVERRNRAVVFVLSPVPQERPVRNYCRRFSARRRSQ